MKLANTLGRFAVWLAVLGFCLPAAPAVCEETTVPPRTAPPRTAPLRAAPTRAGAAIADVALAPGGVLVGRIVDAQGSPSPAILVTVLRGSKEVARTTTDANGAYTVRGLHGGVYHVVAGEGMRMCRLWVDRTAPPAAQNGLLVVSDPMAILAQWGPGSAGTFLENAKCTLTNPLVIAGIVATAIAVPVAIHNSKSGS